jgi:hypothetical protein
MNLSLVETSALLDEIFSRFDAAGFIGQTLANENDLRELITAKGPERIVQGLCYALAIRCESSIRSRTGPSEY